MSALEEAGQDPQNVIAAALSTMLTMPGRREFKLVVDDGRVIEWAEAHVGGAAPADEPYLTMREAAKFIKKSYGWLVRNWQREGLHRIEASRPNLFERKDLEAHLLRHRHTYRGRPRKGIEGRP